MRLTFNIKPQIIKGTSIPNIKEKIQSSLYFTIGSNYVAYTTAFNQKTVYVYNIEKRNAKRIRDKNGKYKKVKEAEVIAYLYEFDIEMLKKLKLEVNQGNRTFTIQSKK